MLEKMPVPQQQSKVQNCIPNWNWRGVIIVLVCLAAHVAVAEIYKFRMGESGQVGRDIRAFAQVLAYRRAPRPACDLHCPNTVIGGSITCRTVICVSAPHVHLPGTNNPPVVQVIGTGTGAKAEIVGPGEIYQVGDSGMLGGGTPRYRWSVGGHVSSEGDLDQERNDRRV